ncbi:hypothetical protein I7I51_03518 [Histoplasma capsulatum]|uniref:Uncharacterized protein n=1 Tax=Ajellomyces capsulatus TaxID=5037 RepID=A0A8A1M6N4_AJECA|nr:hypothetical protein I7I51_03518 [Histoplasma capsulatum]
MGLNSKCGMKDYEPFSQLLLKSFHFPSLIDGQWAHSFNAHLGGSISNEYFLTSIQTCNTANLALLTDQVLIRIYSFVPLKDNEHCISTKRGPVQIFVQSKPGFDSNCAESMPFEGRPKLWAG